MVFYVITNLVNGKQYVGITADVDRRRRYHFSGHGSKLVSQAARKYGKDKLAFEIWYEGDEDCIKSMEYRTIVALNTRAPNGYNLTLGGEGTSGLHPGVATRQKMSEAHKGQVAWMSGRHHSAESREKMRVAWNRKPKAGAKNPRARRVVIDGIEYGCIKDAALATGVNVNTLYTRLRQHCPATPGS